VRRLNELVTGTELTDMATMCVLAIAHDSDAVRMVSAGHPPPVLIPKAGPPRLAASEHGVVLGVAGASYEEWTFEFAVGDRLMLYTDGLVERPGELIDDAVDNLVAECAGVAGLEPLREHVVKRLVGATHPRDDVAMLLAERCVD
jgi:serine phosphatase RsbU (regulator of sigma subunit)